MKSLLSSKLRGKVATVVNGEMIQKIFSCVNRKCLKDFLAYATIATVDNIMKSKCLNKILDFN